VAPGRHHGQPQRRPVRPAPARGVLRRAPRHPRAGRPRLRRGGLPRSRRHRRAGAAPRHAGGRPRRPRRARRRPRRKPSPLPGAARMSTTTTPPGADLPDHPDFLWRNPEPKSSYDVVIVGGGGHGLATAHYLAKNHGITDVAVLEKGWLAGGNMARDTTIIRPDYLWDESAGIYEHRLKLWEGPEQDVRHPVRLPHP